MIRPGTDFDTVLAPVRLAGDEPDRRYNTSPRWHENNTRMVKRGDEYTDIAVSDCKKFKSLVNRIENEELVKLITR